MISVSNRWNTLDHSNSDPFFYRKKENPWIFKKITNNPTVIQQNKLQKLKPKTKQSNRWLTKNLYSTRTYLKENNQKFESILFFNKFIINLDYNHAPSVHTQPINQRAIFPIIDSSEIQTELIIEANDNWIDCSSNHALNDL